MSEAKEAEDPGGVRVERASRTSAAHGAYTRVIITSFEITAIALINASARIQLGDSS